METEIDYNTVENIIENIKEKKTVLVSMTDGSTAFDVIFSLLDDDQKINSYDMFYQSGIHTQKKSVCVSIIRVSSFCFSLDGEDLHPNYIGKKLYLNSEGLCQQISKVLEGLKL